MGLIEVLEMDYGTFSKYSKYIPILEARERLVAMDANQYPNLKVQAQQDKQKKIWRQAFPIELNEQNVLTTDQLEIELTKIGGFNGK